jgi:hypothetical protein
VSDTTVENLCRRNAAIVEFLTDRHLGTQVTGTVYLGAA